MLWRTYSRCQNSRNSFCCNLFKVDPFFVIKCLYYMGKPEAKLNLYWTIRMVCWWVDPWHMWWTGYQSHPQWGRVLATTLVSNQNKPGPLMPPWWLRCLDGVKWIHTARKTRVGSAVDQSPKHSLLLGIYPQLFGPIKAMFRKTRIGVSGILQSTGVIN